jgi:hypothetical protein
MVGIRHFKKIDSVTFRKKKYIFFAIFQISLKFVISINEKIS